MPTGPTDAPSPRPRSVGVVGGGTAGYFAALAIKRRFPEMNVAVIQSKDVPIIGVGEATTTLMPPFLHGQLGLDIGELFREVRPTFKVGIKFEWGLPGTSYSFAYPFGDSDPIGAIAFDGDLRAQSLPSLLMAADRVPVMRGPDGQLVSLLPDVKFAYHLNNAPFVAFLARAAERAGITHEEMKIESIVPRTGSEGVDALRGADGRELRFDFYVDASGFRSLLLEKSLGSVFDSYESSLFCDRAIVGAVPPSGTILPYTTAETMESGWCWRIPVVGEDHRGYVYSSSFLGDDEALAELRAKNPGLREPSLVRFRSGRHRDFWRGNVVAIGNAYGFVEPLESTALHMVIVEIDYLLAGLELSGTPTSGGAYPAFASQAIGSHWDYLRWFLSLHYKFNRRLDTRFWRAARSDVDISGLAEVVRRFQEEGPWEAPRSDVMQHGDPAFGLTGAMTLLLGQQVAAPVSARDGNARSTWAARVTRDQATVRWSLPQDEALAELEAHPELLVQFASSPRSWCVQEAHRVAVVPTRGRVHPRTGMPPVDPLAHLVPRSPW